MSRRSARIIATLILFIVAAFYLSIGIWKNIDAPGLVGIAVLSLPYLYAAIKVDKLEDRRVRTRFAIFDLLLAVLQIGAVLLVTSRGGGGPPFGLVAITVAGFAGLVAVAHR